MKINSNSWHYKFYTFITSRIPTNLCGYFWTIIFGLIGILIAIILFFTFLYALIITIYKLITWDLSFLKTWFIVFIVIFIVRFILEIVFKGIEKLTKITINKIPENVKEKSSSFSNVVKEYIKSRKNKVCPNIEVE